MAAFSIPIGQLAAKMNADLDLVVRRSTVGLFRRVVLPSPVGNPDLWKSKPPPGYVGGRFRANWNVSFGAPDFSTTTSTDKTRGEAEASKALTLPVGGIVYIANGLPYANELEFGHSTQAPNGMVRLAVVEFEDIMRKAIAET